MSDKMADSSITAFASIELSDVLEAKERIRPLLSRTPLVFAHGLSKRVGVEVYLKCENLQVTSSFKARGATNFVLALMEESKVRGEELHRGVITASSGNHGQAVAFAAKQVGLPCVVVVPEDVIGVKERAIQSYDAEVIRCGVTSTARISRAEEIAKERGYVFVPPYDHPYIAAGQGTAGLEIVEQLPELKEIFVPVGGGGLISGVATAIKANLPAARVVGVEPEIANDTFLSLQAGVSVDIPPTTTMADGLRTSHPGTYTFPIVQKLVDEIHLVSEARILEAMRELFAARLVVEPSGATSVAALLDRADEGRLSGPVVCLLSGGNVDTSLLMEALG